MSDGELKNRLISTGWQSEAEWNTIPINRLFVERLIDEVKKEFPLVSQHETIDSLNLEIKKRQMNTSLIVRDRNVIAVLEWALKWFGDGVN